MKYFYSFCRIFVGVLFIISGLIKANDPRGFSYKMEEYFEVFKVVDSIPSTTYEMRDLTPDEVTAVLAGTSTLKPTDYNGVAIDTSKEGVENEFMYVKESKTVMLSKVRENYWFNDFCEYMHDKALELSILMCLLEIVLGALLLAGYWMKATTVFLFLLILFFGFLTFYSAHFNKVTDCGCFGDALKFTPWQSFYKDMVLGIFVIPLLFDAFISKKIDGRKFDMTEKVVSVLSVIFAFILSLTVFKWYFPGVFILVLMVLRAGIHIAIKNDLFKKITFKVATVVITIWFTMYCLNHLPIKDYRPWAIGNSIPQKMIAEPEWADMTMVYKNKKTGEEKSYLAVTNTDGKPQNHFEWMTEQFVAEHEFVRSDKKINKEGVEAPIHDFSLDNAETGEAYAQTFIFKPGYKFMLVAYDITKTNKEVQPKVNEFAAACQAAGIEFIGATSSRDSIEAFRHSYQNAFPYYLNDATSLKTIIRSNPGLVMIKDTVVAGMWHYNDFPKFEDVKKNLMK